MASWRDSSFATRLLYEVTVRVIPSMWCDLTLNEESIHWELLIFDGEEGNETTTAFLLQRFTTVNLQDETIPVNWLNEDGVDCSTVSAIQSKDW